MNATTRQKFSTQPSVIFRKTSSIFFVFTILVCTLLLGIPSHAGQAQTAAGQSEYYVPGSADQLAGILYNLDPYQLSSPFMLTNVVTISVGADNTTIQYDHWENGYGTAVETYSANRGSVLTFRSTALPSTGVTPSTICTGSVNPNGASTACYDGRDHISVTGGTVSIAQVFWPTSASTLYANAWEIYPVKPYQTSYILPIGEDLFGAGSFADFQKVYVIVQALAPNTQVQIDDPAAAGIEVSSTLNQGGVTQYWHAHVGTTITANNPVQVQFIVGNNSTHYNSRGYTAVPSGLWSTSYLSPVPGAAAANKNTDLFIYNPNPSPMSITYQDTAGSGSFQVAANTTVSYQARVGRYVPLNSGVSLSASDGVTRFWAIGSADAGSADYNWGFALMPEGLLADEYFVNWSPGSSNLSTDTNGSPLFVSPSQNNTTIFVDYGPTDGTIDATYTLNRLQVQKIFDPDKDNTGTRIWATAPFAAVWGEDPDSAPTGSPGIDAGYNLMPYNKDWIDIVMALEKTADPSSVAAQAGQTTTFTLTIDAGPTGIDQVYVTDVLPAAWSYIPGSTTISWPDGSSTADPAGGVGPNLSWGSAGSPLGNLDPNERMTIVYRAQTTSAPSAFSFNLATLNGVYDGYTYTASDSAVVVTTQSDLSVVKTNDVSGSALAGYPFTWSLQVLNGSSSGAAQFANGQTILSDYLPAGPAYSISSVTAGAIPPGGTGVINCSLASNVLTCAASGGTVLLPTGAQFTVTIVVIPAGAGTLVNPSGGVCQVDPGGVINESNETNNNCANTVTVITPPLTMAKSASPASGTTVALGSAIAYSISINNTGSTTQNNVVVNDVLPIGTTYVAGSGQLTYPASTYADNFTAQAYTNNNGSANFSGNWIESDTTQSATADSVRIVNDATTQPYVLRPGNNPSGTPVPGSIYRVAGNLSSCTAVNLTFTYRRAVALESGDFVYLDASSNGGGAWTQNVWNISSGPDAAYQNSPTINLTAYRANLAIRFRSVYAENSLNDVDTAYIDNVRLICLRTIPVHEPTHMLTPADNIDLPAGMSMTLTYSVTVNNPTPPGQNSIVNTAHVFSADQIEPLDSTTTHPLPLAALTGMVYNDLNGNGSFDSGEPGIDGVTITLSNGATTTTNGSGFYSFANLPAGAYRVTETDPSGYASTGDVQGANDNIVDGIILTAGSTFANNNFFDRMPDPPVLSKAFGAPSIPLGGNTTLTLAVSNPAVNPTALTAVQVDDGFPLGLALQNTSFIFTPPGCGTVTNTTGAASAAGDTAVRFTAATLPRDATCQVLMNVTSSTPGAILNTTGAVTSAETGPGLSASASLFVDPPDLTVAITNDAVSGLLLLGDSFTWTLTMSATGDIGASFQDGQTIVSLPLPPGPTYGAVMPGNFTAITNDGNIACAIASGTLTCSASGGPVTIGAGGSFTAAFPATPVSIGTLNATAAIDPNGVVVESNESNNTDSDEILVVAIDAVDDTGVEVYSLIGGTTVTDVLANDTYQGGQALLANVTLSVWGSWPAGITLHTDTGAVTVNWDVRPGSYSVQYQICSIDHPTICDIATVTIPVIKPTAVNVINFRAVRIGPNSAVLHWETANELNMVGFNLYRQNGKNSPEVRLNTSLIPVLNAGEMTTGSYLYFDYAVPEGATYFYRLESISVQTEPYDDVYAVLGGFVTYLPYLTR